MVISYSFTWHTRQLLSRIDENYCGRRDDSMPHYSSYDSFQTKKSKEKKERAKARKDGSLNSQKETEFVLKEATENTGIVIETRYNDATVLFKGELITAHLRRGLNMVCNQTVFPGDVVVIDKNEANEFSINNLVKRVNVLARTKKDSTRNGANLGSNQMIATNIDIAVIVVSAQTPPLHPKFIDRYLMILQDSGIPCAICLNKSDLKTEKDEKILDTYRKLNIPVIETSAAQKVGMDELKKILKGRQAIFVGHSGVGKSSLTNALMDSDEIETSHVSSKSGKGRHTTTTSKYYIWDENSSIIDTPGIRSLDASTLKPEEIKEYFSEFSDWGCRCKYSNCLHFREPIDSCMVKQAVRAGIITRERYESYVRILKDVAKDKKRTDRTYC